MDNLIKALMTSFNQVPFRNDVRGRLYYGQAPDEHGINDWPYAVFYSISDDDADTFTENLPEICLQFSLFSREPSPQEIMTMKAHLESWLKGRRFVMTGMEATAIKVNGNGPYPVQIDIEDGTGKCWQYDTDYNFVISTIF